MKAVGYLYPWDVVGDPDAAARIRDAGVGAVALAAAYHGVRGVTPWHPAHRIVEARHSAVYVADAAESVAASGALRPLSPSGWAGPDDFLLARDALQDAGLDVRAWCVLTHYDAPGTSVSESSVVNAFGDAYGYALCPSQGDVRRYAAQIVRRIAARADVDAFVLEAPGQLGMGHASLHEKSAGADVLSWQDRLLSICFCRGCSRALRECGQDPSAVARRVREALAPGATVPVSVAEAVGEEGASVLLAQRRVAASALLSDVFSAAGDASPRPLAFALHSADDPWATGPFHAVSDAEPGISTYVVPVASVDAGPLRRVRAIVGSEGSGPGLAAHVNLTGDNPPSSDLLARLVSMLRDEGAAELHLYHLGLVGPDRLSTLACALRRSAF